jgi:hypothetical protein
VPYAYPSDDVNGSYDNSSSYDSGSSYNSGDSGSSYDSGDSGSPGANVSAQPADSGDNVDANPVTGNVAESTPTVLLYLKDGTVFPASDYWVADNRLHFRVSYGGESTIDMGQLDFQRTVNENAKRNIRFSLKPRPDAVVLDPATSALNTDGHGPGSNAPAIRDAGADNLAQPIIPNFTFAPQPQPAPQVSGSL